MKSRAIFRPLTLTIAFGVLAAGCATTPEEDPMVVKMNDLDHRLERIERVMANQSLLDLAQQLQAMQTDVRTLRGHGELAALREAGAFGKPRP